MTGIRTGCDAPMASRTYREWRQLADQRPALSTRSGRWWPSAFG